MVARFWCLASRQYPLERQLGPNFQGEALQSVAVLVPVGIGFRVHGPPLKFYGGKLVVPHDSPLA